MSAPFHDRDFINDVNLAMIPFFHVVAVVSIFMYGPNDVCWATRVMPSWIFIQCSVWMCYHRWAAHLGYHMCRPLKLVALFFCALSLQWGPIWWVSIHRHHHRTADTQQDFHTPLKGFWHAHVGWLFLEDIRIRKHLVADLCCDPDLVWFDRPENVGKIFCPCVILIYHIADFKGVLELLVLPIIMTWHSSWAVNSVCHLHGSRSQSCQPHPCLATNSFWGIVTLGEGWHNNHHARAKSPCHGFGRPWELDVTYIFVWFFSKIGFIRRLHQGGH